MPAVEAAAPRLPDIALLVCIHATSESWRSVCSSLAAYEKTKTISWLLHAIASFHEVVPQSAEHALCDAAALIDRFVGQFGDGSTKASLHSTVCTLLERHTTDLSAFHLLATSDSLHLPPERVTRLDCLVRQFLVLMRISWDSAGICCQSALLTAARELVGRLQKAKPYLITAATPAAKASPSPQLREALLAHDVPLASKLFREFFEITEGNQTLLHTSDGVGAEDPSRLPLHISTAFAMMTYSHLYLNQHSLKNAAACAETVVLNGHQSGNTELLCAAHYNRYRCSGALGNRHSASEDLGIALAFTRTASSATFWRLRSLVFVAIAEQLLYHPGGIDEALHRRVLLRYGMPSMAAEEPPEDGAAAAAAAASATSSPVVSANLRQSVVAALYAAERCALAMADPVFHECIEAMCTALRCESNRIAAAAYDDCTCAALDTQFVAPSAASPLSSCIASASPHPKVVLHLYEALRIAEVEDEPFRAVEEVLGLFSTSTSPAREIIEGSLEVHDLCALLAAQCLFHSGYGEAALRLLTAQREEELLAADAQPRCKDTWNTIVLSRNLLLSFEICCALSHFERAQQLLHVIDRVSTERCFAPGALSALVLEARWLLCVGNATHAARVARDAVSFGKKLQYRRAVCEAQLQLAANSLSRGQPAEAKCELDAISVPDLTVQQQLQFHMMTLQWADTSSPCVSTQAIERMSELGGFTWSPHSGRSVAQILTVHAYCELRGYRASGSPSSSVPADILRRLELPSVGGVSLACPAEELCRSALSIS